MTTSRKLFSGRITIPGNSATSLKSMMRDSALHWGYETTALTTPSMDSIIGSEVGLVPDGDVWIGSDSSVTNANGIRVAGGQNYSLQDFGPGLIDPNQIYIYSLSGGGADLTFQAR